MPVAVPNASALQPGFICVQRTSGDEHRPWKTGAEVTVKCLSSVSNVVQDALKQADEEWTRSLGPGVKTIMLKWVKPEEDAKVRIGEGSGVSWCFHGACAADVVDKTQPTVFVGMGGWRKDRGAMWSRAELLRVARHLVGHIYGASHPLPEEDYTRWKRDVVASKCELGGGIGVELLTRPSGAQWDGCEGSIMRFDKPAELLVDPKAVLALPKPSYTIDGATVSLVRGLYPTYFDVECTKLTTKDMTGSEPDSAGHNKIFLKPSSTSRTYNPLVGLTRIALPPGSNQRIESKFRDVVNDQKLSFYIGTFSDSVLTEAAASWLSFGQNDKRIQTGTVDSTTLRAGSWSTAKNGEHFSKRIDFVQPFEEPPKVVVGICAIDMNQNHNTRAKVYESDVDAKGFTLHLDAWDDTIAYNIGASWLAHDANDGTIRSGKLVHPAYDLQLEDTVEVPYDSPLPDTPRYMWHAFNKLDVRNARDVKVDIQIVKFDSTRVVSRVSTWDDNCRYYGLGGVYVAIM